LTVSCYKNLCLFELCYGANPYYLNLSHGLGGRGVGFGLSGVAGVDGAIVRSGFVGVTGGVGVAGAGAIGVFGIDGDVMDDGDISVFLSASSACWKIFAL